MAQASKIAVLLVIVILAGACKEDKKTDRGIPSAAITASAVADQITVEVKIPEGHHAYLNEGPHGNLIPVAFDWKSAVESGKLASEPVMKKSPAGETESLTGALVLKGTGDFIFDSPTSPVGINLRVRTQICNETSGTCYRPEWQQVTVQ